MTEENLNQSSASSNGDGGNGVNEEKKNNNVTQGGNDLYICVWESEDVGHREKLELPIERDDTLSLQTLIHAFPDATGLKYKNPNTGAFRALALDPTGSKLQPPGGGWGDRCYDVIRKASESVRRRKTSSDDHIIDEKRSRLDPSCELTNDTKCSDLVVLNLPFKTTCIQVREYFEQFGTVVVAEIKSDFRTGKPKGFGFVQFADYDVQSKVLAQYEHLIDGRVCQVKIPNSKQQHSDSDGIKIYVGRLPSSLTQNDLTSFFQKEATRHGGRVESVLIPKPHRGFAFITLNSADAARKIIKQQDYVVEGYSLCVSAASPKDQPNRIHSTTANSYGYGQSPAKLPSSRGQNLTPWSSNSAGYGNAGPSHNQNYNNYAGYQGNDMRDKLPPRSTTQTDQNLQAAWQAFWNTLTGGGQNSGQNAPAANATNMNWYNQQSRLSGPAATSSTNSAPGTPTATNTW